MSVWQRSRSERRYRLPELVRHRWLVERQRLSESLRGHGRAGWFADAVQFAGALFPGHDSNGPGLRHGVRRRTALRRRTSDATRPRRTPRSELRSIRAALNPPSPSAAACSRPVRAHTKRGTATPRRSARRRVSTRRTVGRSTGAPEARGPALRRPADRSRCVLGRSVAVFSRSSCDCVGCRASRERAPRGAGRHANPPYIEEIRT